MNLMVFAKDLLIHWHFWAFQLQSPESFSQSIQELVIALQRSGDPGDLCQMKEQFEFLSQIDASPGLYAVLVRVEPEMLTMSSIFVVNVCIFYRGNMS